MPNCQLSCVIAATLWKQRYFPCLVRSRAHNVLWRNWMCACKRGWKISTMVMNQLLSVMTTVATGHYFVTPCLMKFHHRYAGSISICISITWRKKYFGWKVNWNAITRYTMRWQTNLLLIFNAQRPTILVRLHIIKFLPLRDEWWKYVSIRTLGLRYGISVITHWHKESSCFCFTVARCQNRLGSKTCYQSS